MGRAKKAVRGKAAKAAPRSTKKTSSPAKKRPAPKPKVERRSAKDLRLERFVAEYLVDYNGRRAAVAAGYSADSARQTASGLLADPQVQALVQAKQKAVTEALELTENVVLDRLSAIATADPRELVELHRGCCRYCWGKDHLYQRTPREMREDRHTWEREEEQRQAEGKPPVPFKEAGGVGFNPKKDPNPNCPECWGDGELRTVFKDTRDLSPAARLLYAGAEQTQNGLKVRMHSQPEALVNIGKHLGMFQKRVQHTGKDGNPLSVLLEQVSGSTFPVAHDDPAGD